MHYLAFFFLWMSSLSNWPVTCHICSKTWLATISVLFCITCYIIHTINSMQYIRKQEGPSLESSSYLNVSLRYPGSWKPSSLGLQSPRSSVRLSRIITGSSWKTKVPTEPGSMDTRLGRMPCGLWITMQRSALLEPRRRCMSSCQLSLRRRPSPRCWPTSTWWAKSWDEEQRERSDLASESQIYIWWPSRSSARRTVAPSVALCLVRKRKSGTICIYSF